MQYDQKGNVLVIILAALGITIAAAIGAGWIAYQSYSLPPVNNEPQIAIENKNHSPENPDSEKPQSPDIAPAEEPAVIQEPIQIQPEESAVEFAEYSIANDSSPTVDASNQFAFELYNQYKDTNDNVFFSPYSISSALQMTYEGARGQTAEEMKSVFHFPKENQIRIGSFAKLYEQINPQNASYQLSTANALWAQKDYSFDQNYLKTVETYYHGKTTNLDFANQLEESRITINQWVSDRTAQKIPELFAPGSLDPLTRLVLTNAVYFRGKWATPFEKEATREKDFATLNGTKTKCQMMNKQKNYNYTETADYQVLELPYENSDLSMIAILPQDGKMASVENSLTAQNFATIKNVLKTELVNVSLPKFKFDTSYNMNEALSTMGMPAAFNPETADFSGMTGKCDLYIGLVIHKAYIDVYEEGTEAAAATGVAMIRATATPMAQPQPKIFNADHPFIFAITHNNTGAILFIGKVNDPNK